MGEKFKNLWHAESIFKNIEKKNPDFYPKPIEENPLDISIYDFTYIEEGFMTRHEIIKVHSQCCGLLHAKNPYAQERNYEGFIVQVPIWIHQINKLLDNHQIKLLDDDGNYFVTMRDPATGNFPNMYYQVAIYPNAQN